MSMCDDVDYTIGADDNPTPINKLDMQYLFLRINMVRTEINKRLDLLETHTKNLQQSFNKIKYLKPERDN